MSTFSILATGFSPSKSDPVYDDPVLWTLRRVCICFIYSKIHDNGPLANRTTNRGLPLMFMVRLFESNATIETCV